jgi:Fur family ferric uptake transcriptional regulator
MNRHRTQGAPIDPTRHNHSNHHQDLTDSRTVATLAAVASTPEAEQTLRAAGLRVTRPRIAVLNTVHEHPHADTNAIIEATRTQLGEVSHQAVYDVLQALTSAGLLRRIQPSGSVARYEARVADNHHHIVCRACGAVADVDCAVGSAPCLTPSAAHGYAIDEAEVIYWGLCPTCAAAADGAAAGHHQN